MHSAIVMSSPSSKLWLLWCLALHQTSMLSLCANAVSCYSEGPVPGTQALAPSCQPGQLYCSLSPFQGILKIRIHKLKSVSKLEFLLRMHVLRLSYETCLLLRDSDRVLITFRFWQWRGRHPSKWDSPQTCGCAIDISHRPPGKNYRCWSKLNLNRSEEFFPFTNCSFVNVLLKKQVYYETLLLKTQPLSAAPGSWTQWTVDRPTRSDALSDTTSSLQFCFLQF